MIKYREYTENDSKFYLEFATRNFGYNSQQSKKYHLDWLRSNNTKNLSVAVHGEKIVGCIHSFRAFMSVDKKIIPEGTYYKGVASGHNANCLIDSIASSAKSSSRHVPVQPHSC